jgi:uncharacterized protein YggE
MRNRHLIPACITGLLAMNFAWAQQQDEFRPAITVVGSSEVKAVPDLVDFQVGLETRNADLKSGFSDQEARIRQILAVIQGAGIDDRDVQTSYVEVHPVFSEQKAEETLHYYILRKTIGIVLRNPAKYDELLPQLLQSGANRVFGVTFRNSKQRQYRDQARDMAVTAAREKAAAIAAKLGRQLGQAFAVEEETVGPLFGSPTANATAEAFGAESDIGQSGLALGQITFRASLKISFELK